MKLTLLDLSSFRSYRNLTLNLDAPRVLIAGRNGSGKTSIREAIRWALLGFCEGTDARGVGGEALIPTGAQRAEVSVGLDIEAAGSVGLTATRTLPGGFAVTGFTGSGQVQQHAFLDKLATSPAFLNAVLDTAVFLNLAHADAMVLSLLDVKIRAMGEAYTLDALDDVYKRAFDDRRVAKKVLAGHVVSEFPKQEMPELDAIDGQLAKLRVALGERQTASGTVSGKRSALEDEYNRLKVVADTDVPVDLSEKLAALNTMLTGLEAVVTPAPEKTDPQYLMFLRKTVSEIQQHAPANGCIIDKAVPCKTAAKLFGDRLSVLNTELKAMDPRTQAVTENPLTTVRRQIQDIEAQQIARGNTIREQLQAEERMQAIELEIGALPTGGYGVDPEIAKLQERITKGEKLLADARAHWAAVAAHAKAVEKQTTLKAEVDRLEELVAVTGPNGARAAALAEAMGRFESAANPYLQAFGWTIRFSVEPWQVYANDRPLETYSKSERYRIGIALQMAIAMLSGLKFAVVDEMDMLDIENRSIVTKMLLSAPLDQILILGTREPSQKLPAVPGVLAYRLENVAGESSVAESVAA